MKLYGGPLSLFSRKVEIALAEKGLSYERLMVPFTQTGGYSPRNPDVLALNPKGQVPVFVDGVTALYDSTVIVEYLEDAYPVPALYPRSPGDRARCRLLDVFADEVLVPALMGLAHRTEPGPRDSSAWRDREQLARGSAKKLDASFLVLERELQGHSFLCGDKLSVADISAFVAVFYVQRLGGPPTITYGLLHQWFSRLRAREAFAEIIRQIIAADTVLSERVDGAFFGHSGFP